MPLTSEMQFGEGRFTPHAMVQPDCFKATELALTAQAMAEGRA
jgi:hypothetical protein